MNNIQHINFNIDAFLMGRQFGTLFVDDGQAYLELAIGELIKLDDSYSIEVINGDTYYPITYAQAINTTDDYGWSTFAGLDCRVRKKR